MTASTSEICWNVDATRVFIARLFEQVRVPAGRVNPSAAESRDVADSLVDAHLRGHDSHGLLRVLEYVQQLESDELRAGVPLTTLAESSAHFVGDANRGFGQVQCRRLIDVLWTKASQTGVASGTMRNCGHVGRLGEWAERIAGLGGCGLVAVTDNGVPRVVSPPGGLAPVLSTNPVALGVPTADAPLVLDISTSAVANGKLKAARLAGASVPNGWIQDAHGRPSTDPRVMLETPPGTLLPFGGEQGYKAFGLAVLLDALVSGLAGGCTPPAPAGTVEFNNVLMVVWAPGLFSGEGHVREQASHLVDAIRSSPRKDGVEALRLPGDRSRGTALERARSGLPVPPTLKRDLFDLAQRLGVVPPDELSESRTVAAGDR
jgi:uncharacterized oxidoreductase